MDSTRRRQRMVVRVYHRQADHDRDDAAYWAAMPLAARSAQVWALSEAQWRISNALPDEPRLRRSVAHVRRP